MEHLIIISRRTHEVDDCSRVQLYAKIKWRKRRYLPQLPPQNSLPVCVNTVNLENNLCQIKANVVNLGSSGNSYGGFLLPGDVFVFGAASDWVERFGNTVASTFIFSKLLRARI
jgi:hypothetical protein